MKTFIYLPFIALIMLASCKSNSFTTQRYTKYGHASHKNKQYEVVVTKQNQATEAKENVETEVVKSHETPLPVKLVTSGISAIKEAVVSPKNEEREEMIADEDNMVTIQGEAFVNEGAVSASHSKASVQSQKVTKANAQHARGLLGSAFETAVWIVLVVIFVILIIFLLSVIF